MSSTGVEPREGKSGKPLAPKLVMDNPRPRGYNPGLNPGLTFENFVEGKSNKLSLAIAQAIADHPSQQTFNPLFIWGPSGVGKTHLVNALGVRLQKLYPTRRVLYIPAHDFIVQFTDSRRQNKFNDFIQFYQSIEVLIVDDVHEFTAQMKTLEAFFHIFNHLIRYDKQIILASDRPPVDLKGMEEYVVKCFACGVVAEIEKPDLQLCIDILNAKCEQDGLEIPAEVSEYVSNAVTSWRVQFIPCRLTALLKMRTSHWSSRAVFWKGTLSRRCSRRVSVPLSTTFSTALPSR